MRYIAIRVRGVYPRDLATDRRGQIRSSAKVARKDLPRSEALRFW